MIKKLWSKQEIKAHKRIVKRLKERKLEITPQKTVVVLHTKRSHPKERFWKNHSIGTLYSRYLVKVTLSEWYSQTRYYSLRSVVIPEVDKSEYQFMNSVTAQLHEYPHILPVLRPQSKYSGAEAPLWWKTPRSAPRFKVNV